MDRTIRRVIATCDICQKVKWPNQCPEGKRQPVIVERIGELVACDYYGPLPRARGGFMYIFEVVNIFSKYLRLYPVRRATTAVSVKKIIEDYRKIVHPEAMLRDQVARKQCRC